jgi:hypothetical protein
MMYSPALPWTNGFDGLEDAAAMFFLMPVLWINRREQKIDILGRL